MVQWLRLCASTAGGTGSIPGRGTKIPHAVQRGQKKKKKKMRDGWELVDKYPSSLPLCGGNSEVCSTDSQRMSIRIEPQLPVVATYSSSWELSGMFLFGMILLDIFGMISQISSLHLNPWPKRSSS